MISEETAGNPQSEQKWIRSSLRKLSVKMKGIGHKVSHSTIGRLLKTLDYSLKANVKKDSGKDHPDRNKQFEYIASKKEEFMKLGFPIISVDSKKKELIGNFKNDGQVWCQEAEHVNTYDFPSSAKANSVPYGIYDIRRNEGSVYVGKSANTSEFAVDCIVKWWNEHGKMIYPHISQLLILADGGGSNGYRSRYWKKQLQEEVSNALGLSVTVCHYPKGCSKWNPVEHRLFSQISINWAGKPLRSFDIMLNLIRGTTTSIGLKVKAFLVDKIYEKGKKVTNKEMKTLNIQRHNLCPNWNYTIQPNSSFKQTG